MKEGTYLEKSNRFSKHKNHVELGGLACAYIGVPVDFIFANSNSNSICNVTASGEQDIRLQPQAAVSLGDHLETITVQAKSVHSPYKDALIYLILTK
ncbi:3243_t:CDS:2 [Entrophospora sp. SA101]|nr:3243_t:CDS:2 [Entrophospora sp. SA101]